MRNRSNEDEEMMVSAATPISGSVKLVSGGISQLFGTDNVVWTYLRAPYASLSDADNAAAVTTVQQGEHFYIHVPFSCVWNNPGLLNVETGWAVAVTVTDGQGSEGKDRQNNIYITPYISSTITGYFKISMTMALRANVTYTVRPWFSNSYLIGDPPHPW